MAKYLSARQKNLTIGIESYSENKTSLQVIGKVGIGTTNASSQLDVVGDVKITGITTLASNGGITTTGGDLYIGKTLFAKQLYVSGITTSLQGFVGNLTGTATTATKLETSRTFEITGDIVASPISFNGTGNVSLAATIQPNSVELGTDTYGDYVQTVSGTVNQIQVTGGTGESSTPIISFAPNPTIGGNVTIGNNLQVNNDLNVTGNITVGGTTGYILVQNFNVSDADIVLGFTTDAYGNDVSKDSTANHGGIAIASTEGSPLVQLVNVAIGESLPGTYKKFMWFQAGAFAGLNTDAWLSNYAIGIGSTQFPAGTRLAAGAVQFTEQDLAVVRNINASGIITGSILNVGVGGTVVSTTSTGFVGIGTTNPQYTLDVNGNINFNGSLYQNSSPFIASRWTAGSGNDIYRLNGNVGVGTTNPTEKLAVRGNILVNDTTLQGSITTTTSTTSAVSIHSNLSSSVYRSVEYTIQATQGSNFHATKILALHDGSSAYLTEYGTIYNNASVSGFNIDISGGNIRLLAIPASALLTNYTINFVATKI